MNVKQGRENLLPNRLRQSLIISPEPKVIKARVGQLVGRYKQCLKRSSLDFRELETSYRLISRIKKKIFNPLYAKKKLLPTKMDLKSLLVLIVYT